MNKYEPITKYLKAFHRETFGKWSERKGEGTLENPYSMPYFIYDKDVLEFIDDFYRLGIIDYSYNEHLEAIENKSMEELTESELITRLTFMIRGDRFSEGFLNSALKNGTVQRILERLGKF